MKNLLLLAVLGAFSLSTTAQTVPEPTSPQQQIVPVSGSESRIDLPADYHKMWPSDYSSYIKSYTLSNGMTLSIVNRNDTMYASVDRQWHKIVSLSPNTFVALDKKLKMHINLLGDDDASGEVLMVVPARQLANGDIVPEQFLSIAMQ